MVQGFGGKVSVCKLQDNEKATQCCFFKHPSRIPVRKTKFLRQNNKHFLLGYFIPAVGKARPAATFNPARERLEETIWLQITEDLLRNILYYRTLYSLILCTIEILRLRLVAINLFQVLHATLPWKSI